MFKIGNSICTTNGKAIDNTYNQGLYHGGVVSSLYKTVKYEINGQGSASKSFYKYELYNAVQSTGQLPSSIYVPQNASNTYGYHVVGTQYDNNLGTIVFGGPSPYGLYLDNCYNKNSATTTIGVNQHASITFENNCLANISGTMNFENVDYSNPVYFGNDCCPHMDFSARTNADITRIGSRSFRNIGFGPEIRICEVAPDAGVDMTKPMTFGNNALILFDLRPFIEAHSAHCNDLGIKAVSITGNDPHMLYADEIFHNYRYSNWVDFDWLHKKYTNLTPAPTPA